MIRYVQGDLLEAEEVIIAHGCNAQGAMNSGVARALRDKWPAVFRRYVHEYTCHKNSQFSAGSEEFLGTAHLVQVEPQRGVLNLITQLNYGRSPNHRYLSYDALDEAMRAGIVEARAMLGDVPAIGIPLIGAGLAQGRWPVIVEILREISFDTGTNFSVYVPDPHLCRRLEVHEEYHGRVFQGDYSAT